jgi:hypothetical protein
MVGAGALQECLAEPQVQSVIAITRSRIGRSHPKLREVLQADFFAYDNVRAEFASCDACFFCLGVTSVGLSEPGYFHLTYDLTLAAAREMAAVNPHLTFCYISGAGTDSTERGRTMWARVKGKTENALLAFRSRPPTCFGPAISSLSEVCAPRQGGIRLSTLSRRRYTRSFTGWPHGPQRQPPISGGLSFASLPTVIQRRSCIRATSI